MRTVDLRGLSWSDTCRPNYEQWFDRIVIAPHHTSAPRVLSNYADFCARMVRRYAA